MICDICKVTTKELYIMTKTNPPLLCWECSKNKYTYGWMNDNIIEWFTKDPMINERITVDNIIIITNEH
jgi:hypothetical protein